MHLYNTNNIADYTYTELLDNLMLQGKMLREWVQNVFPPFTALCIAFMAFFFSSTD